MDNNFIVNIGRQLGSGGREIGGSWLPVWELIFMIRS